MPDSTMSSVKTAAREKRVVHIPGGCSSGAGSAAAEPGAPLVPGWTKTNPDHGLCGWIAACLAASQLGHPEAAEALASMAVAAPAEYGWLWLTKGPTAIGTRFATMKAAPACFVKLGPPPPRGWSAFLLESDNDVLVARIGTHNVCVAGGYLWDPDAPSAQTITRALLEQLVWQYGAVSLVVAVRNKYKGSQAVGKSGKKKQKVR